MSGVVLIVGAGDYIGAAIARRFAKGGYTVCMGRRNGDKLAPLVAEIEAQSGTAHGYTMDARDEDSTIEIFAKVEAEVARSRAEVDQEIERMMERVMREVERAIEASEAGE